MKKICPYCGRAGELGYSCKGCGYVLQEDDKTLTNANTVISQLKQKSTIPVIQTIKKPESFADRLHPIVRLILSVIGWIIGLPAIFFSLIIICGALATEMDFASLLALISLGILFLIPGLIIIRLFSLKSMKIFFWKYLKYLLLIDILLFFIILIFCL